MNDNAFDEALRRVVADEKMPHAGEAWTRMAARLDAHSSGKGRGLLIPLPVVRWAAAAAVIMLALAAGWWLRDSVSTSEGSSARSVARMSATTSQPTKNEEVKGREEASTTHFDGPLNPPSTETMRPIETPQQRIVRNSRRPFVPGEGNKAILTNTPAPLVATTPPTTEAPTTSPLQTPATATLPSVVSPAPRPRPQEQFAFADPEDGRKHRARTGFDVAGGYGYGGDVPAFSVGVAVRRSVGSRLQMEGALALVGNTPDPIGSTTKSDDFTPTTNGSGNPGLVSGGPVTQQVLAAQQAAAVEAEYDELRARQLYVQAAPVLMYRIIGGLSAGGGPDAQRRISANPGAREQALNSFSGVSLPGLPEWDFGLSLRADYNVTKAVRLGVQYRESVRATDATGDVTKGRNYWMLQAGFRLR